MSFDKYDPRNIERGNQVQRSETRSLDYIYDYLAKADMSKAKVPQNLGGLHEGRNIVGATESHTVNMPAMFSGDVIPMSLLSEPPANRRSAQFFGGEMKPKKHEHHDGMGNGNQMQDDGTGLDLPGLDQSAVTRILQMFGGGGAGGAANVDGLGQDQEDPLDQEDPMQTDAAQLDLSKAAQTRRFIRTARKDQ